jgi:membrane protease YdiL (CAAX protease family)
MASLFSLKKEKSIKVIITQIALTWAVFWVAFSSINTEGIWEITFLYLVFLLFLPILVSRFFYKDNFLFEIFKGRIDKWIFLRILIQAAIFFGVMFVVVLKLNLADSVMLNFFARKEWYLEGASIIIFVNLIFLPVALFCQEVYFRGFVMSFLQKRFSRFNTLFLQAVIFVSFNALIFGSLDWVFLVMSFLLALFLGLLFLQTGNVLISFAVSWTFVLITDGILLYHIEQIKNQVSIL